MTPAIEPALREVVLRTWRTRQEIELEAAARFGWLAQRLTEAGAPEPVVTLASNASAEERRHERHCAEVVRSHGAEPARLTESLKTYAPASLGSAERLCYEVVAQCCFAETESTTTLLQLLRSTTSAALRPMLQELARDEVKHSHLGWAYLSWAKEKLDLGFLAPFLPRMIEGNAGPTFFSAPAAAEDREELLEHGVVPARLRQQLYLETLDQVVLPGFSHLGVDVRLARAWLDARSRPSPP